MTEIPDFLTAGLIVATFANAGAAALAVRDAARGVQQTGFAVLLVALVFGSAGVAGWLAGGDVGWVCLIAGVLAVLSSLVVRAFGRDFSVPGGLVFFTALAMLSFALPWTI